MVEASKALIITKKRMVGISTESCSCDLLSLCAEAPAVRDKDGGIGKEKNCHSVFNEAIGGKE